MRLAISLAWRDSEGVELIEIAEEMTVSLDSLTAPVSYDDVQEKLGRFISIMSLLKSP